MFNSQQLTLADSFSPHRIHTRHKQNGSKSKRRKPLVLVVDDERLIADTMTEILRRCGFHAVCAYEGKSALELARHNAPDFVLTDVVMPVMNGVELAIEIRKVAGYGSDPVIRTSWHKRYSQQRTGERLLVRTVRQTGSSGEIAEAFERRIGVDARPWWRAAPEAIPE